MKHKRCILLLTILFPLIRLSNTEENMKVQDILRRSTNSSGNYSQNSEEDIFKSEAMKIQRKCDTGNYGDQRQNEAGSFNNAYQMHYNDYSNYNNNKSNMRHDDVKDNGYNTNYNYKTDYTNRNNNENLYNSYEYGSNSNGNFPTFSNKNCTANKRPNYNQDEDGHSQGNYDNFHRNEGRNHFFTGVDYDRNVRSRVKRSDKRNNENQCISQCVFGYMELVDGNQIPSETLVIRWLQDHIANNDLRRIKALREVRRCFAKLSTNEVEDGCDFSKQLSSCMNLDLE